MKVLFYQYGNEDWLSIGYLSAVLKRAGHETDLLLEPPLDLYVKIPLISKQTLIKSLLRKAERFRPSLLAVSSTTDAFPHAREMIRLVKDRMKIPVVIGGIQATVLPEYVLRNTEADYVCLGEGEGALKDLVDALQNGGDPRDIPNLWLKSGSEIVRNPVRHLIDDLDSLPFPDKEIFRQYGCLTKDYNIMTGRGCPHNCSYCCNHLYRKMYKDKGGYVRRRSVANVMVELTERKKVYGFSSVYFWDDSFTFDKKWLTEFADAYTRYVGLPFHCLSRPENMDSGTAGLLKRAGCTHINMGIESGSEHIRRTVLNRYYTDEQLARAVEAIKQHGIKLNSFNMFGIPDETPEDMWRTLNVSKAIRPDGAFAFLLKPFPGTDIAKYALEKGLITQADMDLINAGGGGKIQSPERDIINHPHKNLARNMMVYLPLQNRMPGFISSRVERRLEKGKLVNKLTAVLSLFLVDTSRTFHKLGALLNTLRKTIFCR